MTASKIIVEFIGAPSAGKSTICAELFAYLKRRGYRTELLPEYAKQLVYQGDMLKLKDQILVTTTQSHLEDVLLGSPIDFLITDTSLLLGEVYNVSVDPTVLHSIISELRERKTYLTVYVDNAGVPFQPYGRLGDATDAQQVDIGVKGLLNTWGISPIYHHKDLPIESLAEQLVAGGLYIGK